MEANATEGPALVEARDLALIAGYACLAPVAWFVPPARWPALAVRLAGPLNDWFRKRRRDIDDRIRAVDPANAAAIHRQWIANRIESELQYLREARPAGLDVQLVVTGREYLAQAGEAGRGAILWVAPALFAPLLVKRGLAEAGFPLCHLSREYHGPSDSRLGRRLINPLSVDRENHYLEARFPMVDGQEQQALRQLVTALRRGRLISITCASYGRRLVPVPLFGAFLPVATGAPSLALMSGAPLLPVTLARRDWRTFEVIVAPPLAAPATDDREHARHDLMIQYADFLQRQFAAAPASFADWRNLTAHPRADPSGPT